MKTSFELASGWTFARFSGAPYHFEHIDLSDAEEDRDVADFVHVVETINGTYVKNAKPEQVHKNKYFAINLEQAIGLAARMVINFQEVAETVTSIRPADDAEYELYHAVMGYFLDQEDPRCFSDQEVNELGRAKD